LSCSRKKINYKLLKYAVEVNLQKHWSSLQFGCGWGWGDNTTAITLSRLLFNVISLKRGLFTLFSNAEVTIGPTSGFVRHFRFFAFLGKLTLAELTPVSHILRLQCVCGECCGAYLVQESHALKCFHVCCVCSA